MRRMAGDERAVFEDADRVGEDVDVEDPAPRRVRHAVEIAADADHAFVRGAPLQSEDGLVWRQRQRLQRGLFLSEGLIDDTVGRGVQARVGDRIDHSRTKTKSPQTNGIVERFHKTVLDEFYRVAFRKKIYRSITELQDDLDSWVQSYNEERLRIPTKPATHSNRKPATDSDLKPAGVPI